MTASYTNYRVLIAYVDLEIQAYVQLKMYKWHPD